MKKITFISIFLILLFNTPRAQILVNQTWVTTTASPDATNFPLSEWDEVNWSVSANDAFGNLIIVGNTLVTSGNTDVLIVKYDSGGNLLWENTYDGAGSYDYGIGLTTDLLGNVYVTASTSSFSLISITTLKYSSSGTLLWDQSYQESGVLYQSPSAISLDNLGNVIVAGGTFSSTSETDWVILKYDNNGTLIWNKGYDYAGFHEIPVSIKILPNNNITISGFSSPAINNWDFANLELDKTTGSTLSEARISLPNININNGFAVEIDNTSNIFIAGTSDNGNDLDFELIKINSAFDIEWDKKFDGRGLDDKPKALAIDSNGDIIVAGNSNKSIGGTDMLVIKVDQNGDEKWRRNHMAPVESGEAQVTKMQISLDDNIFIAGTVQGMQGEDFNLFMLDPNGDIKMGKSYNSSGSNKDVLADLNVLNGNEIFITGISDDGSTIKYTTVKYDLIKKENGIVLESGTPHHRENEIIVKFLPEYVDTSFVDDQTKRYGDIYDVLSSSVISEIDQKLSTSLDRATLIKIFYRLSTNHTSSTTRLGDEIRIPEFWSAFLLCFPDGTDIETLIDELNLVTDYVEFVEHNYVYKLFTEPNDNFYTSGDQSSLFSTVFPDGHINLIPAWCLETGQSYTKAGIYDSAIYWSHEDFGDGTFGGSQIKGGHDYHDDVPIQDITNPTENHGTQAAGILGALRDNTTGIAGIAGGGANCEGIEGSGVGLYSMVIDNGVGSNSYLDNVDIAPAIVEGAMSSNAEPSGFGLDIMSHSWGGSNFSELMLDAVKFTARNQCTFIGSRGNEGDDVLQYPACYDDRFIINVGASGTDGEYKGMNNGDILPSTGLSYYSSSYGGDMDVIAPGVVELVTTLEAPDDPSSFPENTCTITDSDYTCFNGTSAATPHVAGVVALMHGLHHVNNGFSNNLAPEDFEFLIEKYANDISGGPFNYPVGYDEKNGHGRINAGAVLEKLEPSEWRVFHSGTPDNIQETFHSEFTIVGTTIKQYENIHTYQDVFSANTQIIDGWGRRSSTYGKPLFDINSHDDWADFNFSINQNIANVVATTYRWEVISSTGEITNIPSEPIKTAYSLHLFTPDITGTQALLTDSNIKVNPNPSSGIFSLEFEVEDSKRINFYVFDLTGKKIFSKEIQSDETQTYELDLNPYPNGIYIFQLLTDKGIFSSKLIKQ